MKIRGSVCQVLSDRERSFINIEEETDGKVVAWGTKNLTVLALMKYAWFIFTFDDMEYLGEWVENESSKYEKIIYLDGLEMQ